MGAMECSRIQIERIIEERLIDIHFQPILAPRRQTVVGVEALLRCYCGEDGYVPPNLMFAWAEQKGMVLQLDRLCREKAFEAFKAVQKIQRGAKLFLNLESSVIDRRTVGSGHMVESARRWGIQPRDVVIEINEAKVNDPVALKQFVQLYRGYGFSLALDDIGYGHSNLERITHVRPDVLKIDRSLCSDLEKDYYKQEIFKSLVGLSRRIGALVVAEGVETKQEVLAAMNLGADMMQGYYFARPQEMREEIVIRCDDVVTEFSAQSLQRIQGDIQRRWRLKRVLEEMARRLTAGLPWEYGALADGLGLAEEAVEYVYILNRAGQQVTPTLGMGTVTGASSGLFRAAQQGEDQSLKEYYLHIRAGKRVYVSEPYMSLASGESCITCSTIFQAANQEEYILCADFSHK